MKEEKINFTIAAVVFHIHVYNEQHVAKLFIQNVPQNVSLGNLKEMITAAGYTFQEFNIPWANHYVLRNINRAEPEVIGAFKRGQTETIEFTTLVMNSLI